MTVSAVSLKPSLAVRWAFGVAFELVMPSVTDAAITATAVVAASTPAAVLMKLRVALDCLDAARD